MIADGRCGRNHCDGYNGNPDGDHSGSSKERIEKNRDFFESQGFYKYY